MSDTVILAVLNTVQVLALGYLAYRQKMNARMLNGHLEKHVHDG